MQPLNQGGAAPYSQSTTPAPQNDANAILNECRAVGRAIDDLESRLTELQRLQRGFVTSNGTSNKEIDSMSADIMSGYRGLADRVKRHVYAPRGPGETVLYGEPLATSLLRGNWLYFPSLAWRLVEKVKRSYACSCLGP